MNDTILLDAGPSLLVNLKRLALDPTRIRHIFLTHFHGDHFFGLPFLMLEYLFNSPTPEPLTLIGPPGIEERVRAAMVLAFPDLAARDWPRPTTFLEARPGVPATVDGLTFLPVEVDHGAKEITAYGYRLQLPDGALVYSGDTRMTEAVFTLLEQADAAILEATSEDASPIHLGREALRSILAQAPATCTVFLSHLDTLSTEPWSDFKAIVPRDLQTYVLDFRHGKRPEVRHV